MIQDPIHNLDQTVCTSIPISRHHQMFDLKSQFPADKFKYQSQVVNQVTYLHVNRNKGHVKIGQEF